MRRLAILGSTGSIGINTLQVVRESGGELSVWSLAAGRNLEVLLSQVMEFRPRVVSVASAEDAGRLARMLKDRGGPDGLRPEVVSGPAGNISPVV